MIRIKSLLPFMLMLCTGLMPLQGFATADSGHAGMTVDCVDCEMHDSGTSTCDGADCLLIGGFCGAQNAMSPLPRLLAVPAAAQTLIVRRPPASTPYRSRLDFSIYRPPIA